MSARRGRGDDAKCSEEKNRQRHSFPQDHARLQPCRIAVIDRDGVIEESQKRQFDGGQSDEQQQARIQTAAAGGRKARGCIALRHSPLDCDPARHCMLTMRICRQLCLNGASIGEFSVKRSIAQQKNRPHGAGRLLFHSQRL